MSKVIDFEQLKKDLEFNELNIDKAVIEQPANFVYYGNLWVEKVKEANILKMEVDRVYSELYMKYKMRMAENGEKATEKLIESKILTDEKYLTVYKEYLEAKDEAERYGIIKDAFKQRKDMIEAYVNLLMSLKSGKDSIVESKISYGDIEIEAIKRKMKEKKSSSWKSKK
jgi:hypothetical protein